MFSFTRSTFAAIALLAGMGLANAQTTQEHDAHHPEAGAPAPLASTAGIGMSKMMGGNMEQMPMMRMMRGMMVSAGGDMRMMPFEHDEGRIVVGFFLCIGEHRVEGFAGRRGHLQGVDPMISPMGGM